MVFLAFPVSMHTYVLETVNIFPSRGAGGHATNNLRNKYSANIDCIVPPETLHQDYFR